jgi:hypothetical protein
MTVAGGAVLDLVGGAPHDLLLVSMGIALPGSIVALAIGLGVEGLGRSPTGERDVGAVVWRFVIILFLLWKYAFVFGSVASLCNGIAQRIAPQAAFDQFSQHAKAVFDAHLHPSGSGGGGGLGSFLSTARNVVGDFVFDGLVNTIILLGEGAFGVVSKVANILIGAFYGLGPLALSASVPRPSHLGVQWFRKFVTYCCWPIIIGALLKLLLATGLQGLEGQGSAAVDAFFAALLFLCVAASVPALASALIGSTAHNFVAMGKGVAMQHARTAAAGINAVGPRAQNAMGAAGQAVAAGGQAMAQGIRAGEGPVPHHRVMR